MIVALLFLAQASNFQSTQQVSNVQGTQQVVPVTVSAEDATLNLACQCQCYTSPCYWDCAAERKEIKQHQAIIDELNIQMQQVQASLREATGYATPMPAWCLGIGTTCDTNGDGRIQLREFAKVQQKGGWR